LTFMISRNFMCHSSSVGGAPDGLLDLLVGVSDRVLTS
jgi:hypothetical protein